ncbi:MarP family serine protease [Planctomonas psychrotolerans]|uniref:MarP family serine protease n=1 Tax=Planctomonas psychrotolerans TaxID=2528712 RepID=UPI00123C25AB|nr:MarP family serine protease [Planctomonas psychrotolerans]
MSTATILDLVLLLLFLSFAIYGYRSGLVRSLSGILGIVAGGVAALFVVPIITPVIPAPQLRTPAALAATALLMLIGLSLGLTIGHALRRGVRRVRLGVLDRILGAALTLVASALVASMLAFSIGALGVPVLSQALASSTVIRTVDDLTPRPVDAFLAQLRSTAVQEGLPRIVEAFSGPNPEIPEFDTGGPALAAAAESVVRITGNAYACGRNQSGTGFVIAPDRIATNAHVVAGVSEPVVEVPGGSTTVGRVVYFDPVDDLAVLAVDGLAAPAIPLAGTLAAGSRAVTLGYPYGGPFDSGPAEVISVGELGIPDIYGDSPVPRLVYTLAADVAQGESGGPLLTETGEVVGVIFARATDTENVGYALAMEEVRPVADQAAALTEAVIPGTCTRG